MRRTTLSHRQGYQITIEMRSTEMWGRTLGTTDSVEQATLKPSFLRFTSIVPMPLHMERSALTIECSSVG
jgi:hypothetical protein